MEGQLLVVWSKKVNIIKSRKIWYGISGALFIFSIIALCLWGLKLGIDYTGGVVVEYEFVGKERPATVAEFNDFLGGFGLPDLQSQFSGENSVIVRVADMSTEVREQILTSLNGGTLAGDAAVESSAGGEIATQAIETPLVREGRFEVVGPTVGAELRSKAIWAVVVCVIAINFYIAYAFRKVSHAVSSWKYGFAAIIALIHDVTITTGIFAALGHFWGMEINSLYIVAMLTLLGYSVNDTIVVFDRVRDTTRQDPNFERGVNTGLNRAFVRSLNSSLTTFLALTAIFAFGGENIRPFILALMVGVIIGTYSSLFVASPLLVTFKRWSERKRI